MNSGSVSGNGAGSSLLRRLRKLIKNADLYGQPITLLYKGRATYQTVFGGVITIISRLGIFVFLLILANSLINRESKVTYKSEYSTLYNTKAFPLNQSNFDIAVGIQFYDGLAHSDAKQDLQKFLKVIIDYQEIFYVSDGNGSYSVQRNIVPFELGQCSNDRFMGMESQMSSLGINKPGWLCPQNFKIELLGKIENSEKRMLRLRVLMCQNSTDPGAVVCKPESEILETMKMALINVAFVNSYFDENEFDGDPVKHEVKYLFFNFELDHAYGKLMNIQKSDVTIRDSWLSSIFGSQKFEFYSVGHIDNIHQQKKKMNLNQEFLDFNQSATHKNELISPPFKLQHNHDNDLESSQYPLKLSKVECEDDKLNQISYIQQLLFNNVKPKFNIIKLRVQRVFCKNLKNHGELLNFQRSRHQFSKSVDIIKLVDSLRDIQSLKKLLFKKYQRKLLKQSHKHRYLEQNDNLQLDQNYGTLVSCQSLRLSIKNRANILNDSFAKKQKCKKERFKKEQLDIANSLQQLMMNSEFDQINKRFMRMLQKASKQEDMQQIEENIRSPVLAHENKAKTQEQDFQLNIEKQLQKNTEKSNALQPVGNLYSILKNSKTLSPNLNNNILMSPDLISQQQTKNIEKSKLRKVNDSSKQSTPLSVVENSKSQQQSTSSQIIGSSNTSNEQIKERKVVKPNQNHIKYKQRQVTLQGVFLENIDDKYQKQQSKKETIKKQSTKNTVSQKQNNIALGLNDNFKIKDFINASHERQIPRSNPIKQTIQGNRTPQNKVLSPQRLNSTQRNLLQPIKGGFMEQIKENNDSINMQDSFIQLKSSKVPHIKNTRQLLEKHQLKSPTNENVQQVYNNAEEYFFIQKNQRKNQSKLPRKQNKSDMNQNN
eukprot:403370457